MTSLMENQAPQTVDSAGANAVAVVTTSVAVVAAYVVNGYGGVVFVAVPPCTASVEDRTGQSAGPAHGECVEYK